MKRMSKIAGAVLAGAVAATTVVAAAPAANASTGTRSLFTVLTSDGDHYDTNSKDYDIVTEAARAVLKANPSSPVSVLANGSAPVTAFIPNDGAFRLLVWNLSGKWITSERDVFKAVAGLGIPTVEKVLLYHVVPKATIDSATALKSNGAVLTTAAGETIEVRVRPDKVIALIDKDTNARNPFVVQVDVNKGNKQIAHGIDRVLRPFDLPNPSGS